MKSALGKLQKQKLVLNVVVPPHLLLKLLNGQSMNHVFNAVPQWHPLRHAAMVAIESSAARDRRLFPDVRYKDEGTKEKFILSTAKSILCFSFAFNLTIFHLGTDTYIIVGIQVDNDEKDDTAHGNSDLSSRPYLCTGNDIYLVWEPCTMCAMALVHQRIRRVFYAFPNLSAGALGSVHRLQGEKSLNHQYVVFRIVVPQDILDKAKTSISGSRE
ncbi:tRNA-specific adenosine deaminase TAD3-like [Eucalyptus grandis]|uniref:tRNA-specific adenosine deaminase TAD3-like n=1 Tax=Eucalyptus grandis TaxID=71139 RepID=UPI00192E992A|nr:tRNA-specific adenosine deaminase TAD3-like [Eucalyptus grandis]